MKPRGNLEGRVFIMMVGDALIAVLSFSATVWLRRLIKMPGTIGRLPVENASLELFPWLLAVAGAALISLYIVGTYDEPAASVKERGGLLVASLVTAALLVVFYFAFGRAVPRSVLLFLIPLLYLLLGSWRNVAEHYMPIGVRPVLVLGFGEDARRAVLALEAGEITGHSLLAWKQDLSEFRSGSSASDHAFAPVPEGALDVVFASELPEDRQTLITLLERSLKHDFDLWILPGLADIVASRVVTKSLGDLPLTPVATRGASGLAFAYRRTMDLLLGSGLLVLSLPVLIAASVAVALESPGEPWIRQRRVGRDGKEFVLWKIRTMNDNAEDGLGPTLADKNDGRLTRIGKLLRKTRLDELPQLLHIVGGSMSLIGPRPERPEFVSSFVRDVPAYRLRHLLKPGLTGLAQVMGVYATKPDVKLRYDLGYLFHWNPLLDLFILVRTVATILKGSGT
ncbi:MAG: exopolysaccharide biosynthesis polyprenyl glycosylphosphotransferase [Thermoanaerobaculia bacterium]